MNLKSTNALHTLCTQFVFSAMLTASALAHPGHYHSPDEVDEFDTFRANYLHMHGALEISLAVLAVASIAIFKLNHDRRVRIGAALAFCGSLAAISIR